MQPTCSLPRYAESPVAVNPLDLERLYDAHGDFIRALLARLLGPDGDPDDLTQDVFLLALQKLPADEIACPRLWLCRVAVKLAASARRRLKLRKALRRGFPFAFSDRRTPEVLAEAREETARVNRALDGLSEKKREVFVLFEMLGMNGHEVAASLDIPLATAHTRLHYARREFVAQYERELQTPDDGGRHA